MELTTMKYLQNLLFTAIAAHLLPLNAEVLEDKELASPTFSILAPDHEMHLSDSIKTDISLLDDEFNQLQQELSQGELSKEKETAKNTTPPFIEPALSLSSTQEAHPTLLSSDLSLQPTAQVLEESSQELLNEIVSDLPLVERPFSIAGIHPLQDSIVDSGEEIEALSEQILDAAVADLQNAQSRLEPSPSLHSFSDEPLTTLSIEGTSLEKAFPKEIIAVDLKQAFAGSPVIYSLLLLMSVFSLCIWIYTLFSIRFLAHISPSVFKDLQEALMSNNFDEAICLCRKDDGVFSNMVLNGVLSCKFGLPVAIEAMKTEGKRATTSFWQKLGLLNDVAIIAPMLGLLGTVLGMFYAFYDVNRSIESVSTLFDGLGVSVGTTVAGLIVAILALILHSTAKYRLVRSLARLEGKTQNLALLMDDRTSIYKG